jgi:hypothetical protein
MLEILAPPIERLARQVERTLDYFAQAQQLRCDALHLSGEIFNSPQVMEAVGAQLGFNPLTFDAAAIVGRGAEHAAPEDRMCLAPAIAAALALPERGINLLRTYKTRTAENAKRTVTRALVLGLAGCMLLVGATGFWIEHGNSVKRKELAKVQAQLASLGPTVDEASLQASVSLFKQRQDGLRQAAERFLPSEVLTELALRLPANAKVLSVTMDLKGPSAPTAVPGQPQAPPQPGNPASPLQGRNLLVIEGIITGAKKDFDATLSRLIIDMQASPLFTLPVVHQTSLKDLGSEGQVLFFVLHAGVE